MQLSIWQQVFIWTAFVVGDCLVTKFCFNLKHKSYVFSGAASFQPSASAHLPSTSLLCNQHCIDSSCWHNKKWFRHCFLERCDNMFCNVWHKKSSTLSAVLSPCFVGWLDPLCLYLPPKVGFSLLCAPLAPLICMNWLSFWEQHTHFGCNSLI